jgi:ribosomal protein S18 acetylase RimI-like enzyme
MLQTAPVCPEDEAFLQDLYASTRREEVAAWGWEPAQQDAFLHMQFQMQRRAYAMQFAAADHRLILHDGIPAGCLLVARLPDAIRLVDIALLPQFQGHGLGTAAITALQAESAAADKPLRLTVRPENQGARRLYERLGFTVTAQTDLDETMEWRPPATSPDHQN